MTIIEMREKRAKLWATMEGFLDTHRNDKGVLSAEDDATYTGMEKDLSDLTNEIKRMERRDAIEAELNKPVDRPLTQKPEKHEPEKTGRASNAYKEDFGRHLRGKNLIHNVLSESTDEEGGYLVPEEFEQQIVRGLDEANVIRSIAKVITTHHDRKIPVALGHSSATWTAENAPFTEMNPTFGQKRIDSFKLTDLIRVSVELLQDSEFDLEDYIAAEFARAFGIAEEQAFCVYRRVSLTNCSDMISTPLRMCLLLQQVHMLSLSAISRITGLVIVQAELYRDSTNCMLPMVRSAMWQPNVWTEKSSCQKLFSSFR